jgi:hypothetical protein
MVETGIHAMSASTYHTDPCPQPSLSASIAKTLLTQSPRHAWLAHPRLNPDYKPDEDSRFDLGTAAHAMLLERDASRIVWVEADDWRKQITRDIRDEARKHGQLPLLSKYQEVLQAMLVEAARTLESSELGNILDTGAPEQTLIWREEIWCRARLDLLSADKKVILDYKSTENAQPDAFIRQIGRMSYDVQAQFYTRGMIAATGTVPTFVFLAQEITAPFACSLVSLSNAYVEIGNVKVDRAIAAWARCSARKEWPGYDKRIHYAEPSAWQLAEVNA